MTAVAFDGKPTKSINTRKYSGGRGIGMRSVILLSILICVLASGPQTASRAASQPNQPPQGESSNMPALRVRDLDGKELRSDGFDGSVVVVDFWATWCGPCIAEVPALNRLAERYASKGLKVVGVTMMSGEPKEVKPFVERFKMKYKVVMGDDDQAYDLNILGFPTTYLLTRDRKIFRKFVGGAPGKAQKLEADIQQILDRSSG
jgi:thiol-disulfide isomerase/thioredoxin